MDELRARLLREQDEVQRQMNKIRETMQVAFKDRVGELSTYDNHPADTGSETFERSKDYALQENARLRLLAIKDALRKMDQGVYGRCDECGVEIAPDRLEALPCTTKCRECKHRGEVGSERVRPIEEEALARPFASPGDESIVYDREDIWQDLSRHGLSTEIKPLEDEDRGHTEDVDAIPYVKKDGVFFQDSQVRGDTGGH
jgi:YteA family regulatory protein